jgi:hypothetical protein
MTQADDGQPPVAANPPTIFMCEKDTAALLGLSERTLQNLRLAGGGLAYLKLTTRRLVYARDDVIAWAMSRRRNSTSDTRGL